MMGTKIVTILASGFGLGLYIPGLLAAQRLREKGVPSQVLVFENLISEEKRQSIAKSKLASHKSFSYARMSGKMAVDMRKSLEPVLVERLLAGWEEAGVRDFIILSGHWVYVMDQYRSRIAPNTLNAEILYIDCDLPPSWRNLKQHLPEYHKNFKEVWLFDYKNRKIDYQLPVCDTPPVPYDERPERFLLHGGGWGIGTYMDRIPELHRKGLTLDIVVYDMEEASNRTEGDRYYMVDPAWCAWNKSREGSFEFPPLCEVVPPDYPVFTNNAKYHNLLGITRTARAIIGKPGAGTLIDSLASATPLIMLEPVGVHEQKNSEFWEQMGFGIPYDKWAQLGFPTGVLKELHQNLVGYRFSVPDYTEHYKRCNDL